MATAVSGHLKAMATSFHDVTRRPCPTMKSAMRREMSKRLSESAWSFSLAVRP